MFLVLKISLPKQKVNVYIILYLLLGYGVVATTDIPKGSFLLEYKGTHVFRKDLEVKLEEYSKLGLSYVYEYDVNNVAFWYVDTTG